MIQDKVPTALLLTHKRGAVVCVSQSVTELFQVNSATCSVTQETDAFVVYNAASGICGFSKTTTAEVLHDLWLAVTHSFTLEQLIVGIGPGSFTGLRLGCAYANGLALGNSRLQLFGLCPVQYDNETELLSWSDVASAISQLKCFPEQAAAMSECIPFYGKEPGPVIKLKEQMCLKI